MITANPRRRRFGLISLILAPFLLLGAFFKNDEKDIAAAWQTIQNAVLAGDFPAAEGRMTETARQRWHLSDWATALTRRSQVADPPRRIIEQMWSTYAEMIRSAKILSVQSADTKATAQFQMRVVIGPYAAVLDFPTSWERIDGTWVLGDTSWTSDELADRHATLVTSESLPLPAVGYPPQPLTDQNATNPISKQKKLLAPSKCPREMVHVPDGPGWVRFAGHRYLFNNEQDRRIDIPTFCIDRYEASRPTATKDSAGEGDQAPARSRPGVLPWANVTWNEAAAACERAGKRLCSGPEWQKAMGGPEGLLYGTGNEPPIDQCNICDAEQAARHLSPTGSFPKCKSPYGVYDLVGNVSEWTNEFWQEGSTDRVARGGSYNVNTSDDQALFPFFGWRFIGYSESVAAIHHHQPDKPMADDGFRCCLTR